MAITVANKAQTAGTASTELKGLPAATAGNIIVLFVSQLTTVAAPSLEGFTFQTTHGQSTADANSLFVGLKTAAGGETAYKPTAGAGGTVVGLCYFELAGASTTVDAIVNKNNVATAVTHITEPITTTDAGSVVLACVGTPVGSTGTVSAWSASMVNVGTEATRNIGGSYLPAATLSAVTFQANWSTSRAQSSIVVALKPASGETKIVTALVHGAGLGSVSALKVALSTALVRGAGLASASSVKVALATASVTGAGQASVKASKTASTTALVRGAGNATVTLTPSGEVKIVTALVHGGGRSTVTALHVGLATASVAGAGAASVKASKVSLVTAKASGAGAASVKVGRIALVAANVTGAGRATVTLTAGTLLPCLMVIANWKQASMRTTNGKQVQMVIVNRKASRQTLVNL